MNALAVLSSRERFYEQSRQEFKDIVERLDSEEVRSMTHSDLERELEKMGRELMRKLLQEHLESRGPGESAEPGAPTECRGLGCEFRNEGLSRFSARSRWNVQATGRRE